MARITILGALILVSLAIAPGADAQRGGPGGRGGPGQSPRAAAPVDLTGYWVSVVNEDWRHRMATPRRGDFESLPLSGPGQQAANAWNLEADNAAGVQCRAFGVGGIMRQPGRLRVEWQDDRTLKIDFDAGTQTRLLNFGAAPAAPGEKSWQGYSIAEWETPPAARGGAPTRAPIGNSTGPIAAGGGGAGLRGGPPPPASLSQGGSLKVTTTNFLSGYLRKNGVPYSENARITEYIHRLPEQANGDVWLLVVTVVEDPAYLREPFYTSTHFKREPDGAKFNPTPCRTAPPP